MQMYECKVRYDKTLENGVQSKVTETYIIADAVSISDAYTQLIEQLTPFIVGEFEVLQIKKVYFSELITDATADLWYTAKIYFITINEKTGREKRTTSTFLVQAADFDAATANVNEHMKGTVSDWEVGTVSDTKIIDVFIKA